MSKGKHSSGHTNIVAQRDAMRLVFIGTTVLLAMLGPILPLFFPEKARGLELAFITVVTGSLSWVGWVLIALNDLRTEEERQLDKYLIEWASHAGRSFPFLTSKQYIELLRNVIPSYTGDVVFFNVDLTMFSKKEIFESVWGDAILSRNIKGRIFIAPNSDSQETWRDVLRGDDLIDLKRKRELLLEKLIDNNQSIRLVEDVCQKDETPAALILCRQVGASPRQIEFATIFLRGSVFALENNFYKGIFLVVPNSLAPDPNIRHITDWLSDKAQLVLDKAGVDAQ